MIPIRSLIPRFNPALVTTWFIVFNILVFLGEALMGAFLPQFISIFGLRPINFWLHLNFENLTAWFPIFTSMFLHGGLFHLAGNLLFLWVFGSRVEECLGHARFAALYVGAGFLAAFTQLLLTPFLNVPIIGASGAVAGVLGAYLYLFPRSRVLTFIPVFFVRYLWEIPAVYFVLVWIAQQYLARLLLLNTGDALVGGSAYWAHVGGFFAGILVASMLASKARATLQNSALGMKAKFR